MFWSKLTLLEFRKSEKAGGQFVEGIAPWCARPQLVWVESKHHHHHHLKKNNNHTKNKNNNNNEVESSTGVPCNDTRYYKSV